MAHCFKASSAATTGQGGGTTSAGGGLKRKEIYLCVLNDTSSTHHGNKGGLNISITEVKASDPQTSGSAGGSAGGSAPAPKRKRSWALRELTVIDGRHLPSAATQATNSESGSIASSAAASAADENPEFELRLADKTYTW